MEQLINIDLSDLAAEFSLTIQQSNLLSSNILDGIITDYTIRWQDLVNRELHKSRSEYKRAMYIDKPNDNETIFGLSDRESPLPLMIEEGASPFDEKLGFEKSSKAHKKKNGGWYLTIPFRHATPTAVAESEIFNSILPKDVYDVVRSSPKPLRVNDLPPEQRVLGRRKEIKVPGLVVPEYIHKSPKYEGLVRINIQSTQTEKRGGYFTFRRVSDKSDENSWWNSGIVPKKLMDRALEQVDIPKVTDIVVDKFLQEL